MNRVHERMIELGIIVLIPTYNNDRYLEQVLQEVLAVTRRILVINDGSTDSTADILERYADRIQCISHPENQGKGNALRTGFKALRKKGCTYALTLDSDSQHKASDIEKFVAAAEESPGALVVGARDMEQTTVPGKSSFGHKFSNFWYRLDTGINLPDTQTGYRLYPLESISSLKVWSWKFEFEIEVLVKSAWKGIEVTSVPIDVYYPPGKERITHFRPFWDFTRISLLNVWLLIQALCYYRPVLAWRDVRKNGWRHFYRMATDVQNASAQRVAKSVALGVFIGISPLWGWHTVTTLALAHAFKLNKWIAFAASNVSIPPMIPSLLLGSFYCGTFVTGEEFSTALNFKELDFGTIGAHLLTYIVGSFILAAATAIILGIFVYFFVKLKQKPAK